MNQLRSNLLCALSAAIAAPAAAQGLEPAMTRAAAWKQALATMRTHKAPGLVFVVPPADREADPAAVAALSAAPGRHGELKTARDVFLVQLQLLRHDAEQKRINQFRSPPTNADEPTADDPAYSPPDVTVAFLLAVPVVADAATCGARPGETIMVLGMDGKRRHGAAVDLGDRAAVQAAIAPHLFDHRELRARSANVPRPIRAMVAEFDAARARVSRILSGEGEPGESAPLAWEEYIDFFKTVQTNRFAVAPAALHVADGMVRVRRDLLIVYEPFGTEAFGKPQRSPNGCRITFGFESPAGPELQLLPP